MHPAQPGYVLLPRRRCAAYTHLLVPACHYIQHLHRVRPSQRDARHILSFLSRITLCGRREEFVFSFKAQNKLYYGCCRRFRDLRDLPDRRIDSKADVALICVCIITEKWVSACVLGLMWEFLCISVRGCGILWLDAVIPREIVLEWLELPFTHASTCFSRSHGLFCAFIVSEWSCVPLVWVYVCFLHGNRCCSLSIYVARVCGIA